VLIASLLLAVSLFGVGDRSKALTATWQHLFSDLPGSGLSRGRDALKTGWWYSVQHVHRLRVLVQLRTGLYLPPLSHSTATHGKDPTMPGYVLKAATAIIKVQAAKQTPKRIHPSSNGVNLLGQILQGMRPHTLGQPFALPRLPAVSSFEGVRNTVTGVLPDTAVVAIACVAAIATSSLANSRRVYEHAVGSAVTLLGRETGSLGCITLTLAGTAVFAMLLVTVWRSGCVLGLSAGREQGGHVARSQQVCLLAHDLMHSSGLRFGPICRVWSVTKLQSCWAC
jgi:hypothetical protein